jgi:xylose isomerase
VKHALLVTFFGKVRDRFHEYQQPLSVATKLECAARVPGVTGVELIYPEECRENDDLAGLLASLKLVPAAINVNIKGDPRFVAGALTSPDAAVRRQALRVIIEAKEYARRLGCDRVTCAPLADGYDYPLQVNYARAWGRMVDCLREASEAVSEIALHIEHKPSDPRVRGFLDSPAKVLRLCRDAGSPSLGVTFNFGHALRLGSPAAELARVLDAGVPLYIHHNDGTVNWDWDLMAGAQSLWQFAEFLFYLHEANYDGWFTADTLPIRLNAVEVFASNIRMADECWKWCGRVDKAALGACLANHEAGAGLSEMMRWLRPQN